MFSIPAFSIAFFLCEAQTNATGPMGHGNGGTPIVKITAPANNSIYSWNSLVNYSVVVTWNGKSTQYQEIPPDQVLIRTTYISDLSRKTGEPESAAEPAGLLDIIRSGCIGCHEFKARAMGPSFAAIAARCPDNQASIDILSRYIREGSTGVWGAGTMPPHPEFSAAQLQAIARWIVRDASNPDVNYYVGTEGTIRMKASATPGSAGGMRITASYTAPAKEAPHGEDAVIVHGK